MRYFILLFVILLSSCHPLSRVSENDKPDFRRENTPAPHIIFVIFEITDQGVGQAPKGSIMNKILSTGKLKKDITGDFDKAQQGHMTINFLDRDKKLSRSLHMSNPLVEHVEYVNDNGELDRKEIRHKSKEMILRTSLAENISQIELVYNEEVKGKIIKLSTISID